MTTILISFIIAFSASLFLTPLAGRLGKRWGAVDVPDNRKIHSTIMPRTGGLAIFVSFLLVIGLAYLWRTTVADLFLFKRETLFLVCGAMTAFGIGLVDDFHRVHAGLKFIFHVVAATVAFLGGIRIGTFGVFHPTFPSLMYSYLLTVFWFVLVMNAVNLADGMDGLAGGIVVFACVVIVILNVMRQEYLTSMLFAALGGATLGFLRYNFNPASIFLGDGGSYFLGYAIAGLSIMGSTKTQVGATLLIPVLALGVPIFDTFLAPIRRFIRGQKLFSPDNGHIHHRMAALGLNSRVVVWILYGVTCFLCILAVILVNVRDERAGLFLIVLGAGVVVVVRKLGYFKYFGADKIYGWLKDITDEAGFRRERRSFLSMQMDLAASKNLEGLWENVVRGVKMLKFDAVDMELREGDGVGSKVCDPRTSGGVRKIDEDFGDGVIGTLDKSKHSDKEEGWKGSWRREGFDGNVVGRGECLFKLELPLVKDDERNLGTLWLVKDLKYDPITHYTLRRIEHLRRTIVATLDRLLRGRE